MSLHDRIMNIRLTEEAEIWPAEERIIYKTGNRDARHAAAEMAFEADELMAEMAGALGSVQAYIEDHGGHSVSIEEILDKYNAYKEQSK